MQTNALLVDVGWSSKASGKILNLPDGWPNAVQAVKNPQADLAKDEELFPVLCYDCEPFDREVTNPVDGSKVNYQVSPAHAAQKRFCFEPGQTEFVALRRGELKARAWRFSPAPRQALRPHPSAASVPRPHPPAARAGKRAKPVNSREGAKTRRMVGGCSAGMPGTQEQEGLGFRRQALSPLKAWLAPRKRSNVLCPATGTSRLRAFA